MPGQTRADSMYWIIFFTAHLSSASCRGPVETGLRNPALGEALHKRVATTVFPTLVFAP